MMFITTDQLADGFLDVGPGNDKCVIKLGLLAPGEAVMVYPGGAGDGHERRGRDFPDWWNIRPKPLAKLAKSGATYALESRVWVEGADSGTHTVHRTLTGGGQPQTRKAL